MGVANSITAIEAGANPHRRGRCRRPGRRGGQHPWRCFVAVLDRMGIRAFMFEDPGRHRRSGRAADGLPDPHRPRRADAGLRRRPTAASCCLPNVPSRNTACRRAILVELGHQGHGRRARGHDRRHRPDAARGCPGKKVDAWLDQRRQLSRLPSTSRPANAGDGVKITDEHPDMD